MKTKDKAILSLIIIALLIAFLYAVKSILFPFAAAIIIAYFLDPLADRLQRLKLSRTWATIIILGVFVAIISTLLILIAPLLYDQTTSLIAAIPGYINILNNDVYPKLFAFANQNGFKIERHLTTYFNSGNIASIFNFSGSLMSNIMQSSIVLVNVISLVFITPFLIFYLLRDWNVLVKKINNYLPAKHNKNIRHIFSEIDKTLSGYVHGQFNVCSILGIFYAIGLTCAGLNFGFLIGFLTGFLSFIPYIGMLSGFIIAIIVALFQWGFDLYQIGLISIIFFVGQVFESNFLTPKLVGDKIGLHPVWIIFGLFVFGILMGFVGVLLAMPLTAICGVLVKFTAAKYKQVFCE